MFKHFSDAVHNQYEQMMAGELFVVDVLDIYESYLNAYPEGTNPIFRTKRVHECNCCKQFIRRIGNLVSIKDGQKISVWGNYGNMPHPYNVVGRKMKELIEQAPIVSIFRSKEGQYGQAFNFDNLTGERYEHFVGKVSQKHKTNTPEKDIGDANTTAAVFKRGLEELKPEAFALVLDLIDRNEIYKGAEFKKNVTEFQRLIQQYQAVADKTLFVWSNYKEPYARFRNSSIGTLLVDISDGVDLVAAVKSFEAKVAPQNYKRPTAIVSTKMIDDALAKVTELGLDSALERRHAKLTDISVNNVLYVDNSVENLMKDSLADKLKSSAKQTIVNLDFAQPITADKFFNEVVPTAEKIHVFVQNKLQGNLMTLTTGVHTNNSQLFRWNNDFAWSYNGEVTDSIKERVKAAGGNIDAKLRVSLAWFNFDDLDLHCVCPDGHVYFRDKKNILDVDMNAGSGKTREAVENLSWANPRNGHYRVDVNQYSVREKVDVGFTIQLSAPGVNQEFNYSKPLADDKTVTVMDFDILNGAMLNLKINPELSTKMTSKEVWNIKTESLVQVDTLMFSPNYWDDQSAGNQHWFFILKDCKNPDPVRGIYNEFLSSKLQEHNRVFELLGSKTKVPYSEEQLSGLGFSSTKHDSVKVVVKSGTTSKAYQINF